MRVLLTSAQSQLAQVLARGLGGRHELRLTDRITADPPPNYAYCALGHDLATDLLVSGMDAVVHAGEPYDLLDGEGELSYIDYMTRGTYNLCTAMSAQGVGRLVLLNTLDVMMAYDERFRVTEQWRPVPADEPRVLGKHLAENVCKEFAREQRLSVVVLRIGEVVSAAEGQPGSTVYVLQENDLVQAVDLALTRDLGHWSVFHILSSHSHNKFNTNAAQQTLDYTPSQPAPTD